MSENQFEQSLDLGTSLIRDEKNPAVNHDFAQLEADFAEKFDANHIETATLIKEDGTVSSYEVYWFPYNARHETDKTVTKIAEFGVKAMALGYRSALGSVVLPGDQPRVFFFLERQKPLLSPQHREQNITEHQEVPPRNSIDGAP